MKRNVFRKGFLCLAASAALLLTGCGESSSESGESGGNSDIEKTYPTLSEVTDSLKSVNSGTYDIGLVFTQDDTDPVKINATGMFTDKAFAISNLNMPTSDPENPDKLVNVDYTDVIFVDNNLYINIKKINDAMGDESGSMPVDAEYLQISLEDMMAQNNVPEIDKDLQTNISNVINKTSKFAKKFFDEPAQDKNVFTITIDKNSVISAKDKLIAAIDDGSLKSYIEDIYKDLQPIEDAASNMNNVNVTVTDINDIDYDELKTQLQEMDTDSIPEFSIQIKLIAPEDIKAENSSYKFDIACEFETDNAISGSGVTLGSADTSSDTLDNADTKSTVTIALSATVTSGADVDIKAPTDVVDIKDIYGDYDTDMPNPDDVWGDYGYEDSWGDIYNDYDSDYDDSDDDIVWEISNVFSTYDSFDTAS